MKVFSWNVNSVKARQERLLAFLKRENPDYLCLQELKVVDEAFPRDLIAAAGYHSESFGQKTYNGVAILSREKPLETVRGFLDGHPTDVQSRALGAKFAWGWLFSLYVPNGQAVDSDKYIYKLGWLKRLNAFLTERGYANEATILAGDFNIAPDDRDCHDPAAWEGQVLCSEPERAAFKALSALGYHDLFRKFNEAPGTFSWWDYRNLGFPKNRGMRIDLLMGSAKIAAAATASGVSRDERKGQLPSDHAPVWVEVKL